MSKVFIEESTLTAIGDAIRGKTGGTELIEVPNMATQIEAITTGGGSREDYVPDSALVLSGDCKYKFYKNGWGWFIEKYANETTTNNISDCSYMFFLNGKIEKIPFDFNFLYPPGTYDYQPSNFMFSSCAKLKTIGKLINWYPSAIQNVFYGCNNLSAGTSYFYSHNVSDATNCFYGKNNSRRYNIHVPANSTTLNTFLKNDANSIVGAAITWTNQGTYYYNTTYNIYIYPNSSL